MVHVLLFLTTKTEVMILILERWENTKNYKNSEVFQRKEQIES